MRARERNRGRQVICSRSDRQEQSPEAERRGGGTLAIDSRCVAGGGGVLFYAARTVAPGGGWCKQLLGP